MYLVTGEQRIKMESSSATKGNFGFGFNDIDFSDRVLHLEITPALPSTIKTGVAMKYLNWFSSLDDANTSECGANDFKLKKLHVSSLLLAAESPFFYKLFKNGMRESQQRHEVTIRISASEEVALMDLLKFIYGEPMSATSTEDLVDVLMAADKFEVTRCMKHCTELLVKLPMSLDSAPFYLDLPSSVLVGEVVKPLVDEAKKYLSAHFMDFTESQEEAMGLPLWAIEVVLDSDGLQVDSEEAVFDFILKWACTHYPELEERRKILTNLLERFVCFAYMSCSKWKEVVDFSELVLNSLSSKLEVPYGQHQCTILPMRVYKFRLIKVVQLQFVQPRCIVYFDLRKEECEKLFPSERLYSQTFGLGGKYLSLFAECSDEQSRFVLYVQVTQPSETCILDYEFGAMKKSSMEFTRLGTEKKRTFKGSTAWGFYDLFETPWVELMSNESEYFIDGILHLRAEITLIN